MKSPWSIIKHAMWYASVIFLPIFIVGDFAYAKIPQLLNGFNNPFEIFMWAVQTNGSIVSPWLAATAWRIVVRDPEDRRDFPTLPGFCGGGVSYKGPNALLLIAALVVFALLFGTFRAQMADIWTTLFGISFLVEGICFIPLLVMTMFKEISETANIINDKDGQW